MPNQIIVGSKKNGALFLNVVKNLPRKEEYVSHKKITATSIHGLLESISSSQKILNELGIDEHTVYHNGILRSQSTKELRRCNSLTKTEMEQVKSTILLITIPKNE